MIEDLDYYGALTYNWELVPTIREAVYQAKGIGKPDEAERLRDMLAWTLVRFSEETNAYSRLRRLCDMDLVESRWIEPKEFHEFGLKVNDYLNERQLAFRKLPNGRLDREVSNLVDTLVYA